MMGRWPRATRIATLLLAAVLTGCAPGTTGYAPSGAGDDPGARLRERAEAEYQAGLAHERAGDWRAALRSYEQAKLWDPDSRPELRASVAHARAMVEARGPAAPALTPTFRPGERPGSSLAPTGNADNRNLGFAPTPTRPIPPVGYRAFRSAALPYVIAYPVGWSAAASNNSGESHGDDFQGTIGGRGAARVTVASIALPAGETAGTFIAREVGTLQGAMGFRALSPRPVGGMTAAVVAHAAPRTDEGVIAVWAICAEGDTGWRISLLVGQDNLADALVIFDAMLASFAPEDGQ